MSYDSELKALLTVLEATYGTDPGSGHQGILINKGSEIKPTGDKRVRDTVNWNRSPSGHVIGAKGYDLKLPIELKGGGIDGTLRKPEIDHLLQACAMSVEAGYVIALTSVTGTPDDSWIYAPLSDRTAMKSLTAYFHHDGFKYPVTGVRGTFELEMTVGGYGLFNFDMKGIYNDPTNIPIPQAAVYDHDPEPCENAGLQIASVDMTKTAVNSLKLRIGNEVKVRNDINAADGRKGLEISGMRNAGGSVDPEAIALTDFDPFTAWKDGTAQKIYATIGQSTGNRCRPLVRAAQYEEVSVGGREGNQAYELPFIAKGVNGDDELMLIFY
ncbi:hypothetical protein BOW53_03035 [Solemya pervernicosa gill symbiont]|uniref:Phage tail protein n=1 Tax=Solemya pervernicosa gill symbiont TaxID=642797 RepID=A0A1T2L969_9GAMM|nr:phage tail tube protein [Solemya pervernicosa gill symbiont]OOZ41668.1 hypothetical protein BOW53_03035 [Solemya pervernicosa gill symbiont]